MRVNQMGDPIEEVDLFQCWSELATDTERDKAIALLAEHLGVKIVRTNATKHGSTKIELREIEK